MTRPEVTVVVPVRNEEGNLPALVAEIEAALAATRPFEAVIVDDGSTDGSARLAASLARSRPWLRCIRHERSCGQSAAIRTGVEAAIAPLVVTLDGDGQNDPAFIPALLARIGEAGPTCGLVQGQRVGRRDTRLKRAQSRIANAVRRAVLNDGTRDTGCGLKCFPRSVYLRLPYFDALHRFMPALVRREGLGVALVDVIDRPRLSGRSNYGMFDRLWVGLVDMAGVRWLIARRRSLPLAREIERDAA